MPAQPTTPNVRHIKTSTTVHDVDTDEADPLLPRHLDFSKGVRGKYYGRIQKDAPVILLAPDLIDTFPDSDSVNEALRSLKAIATRTARRA